MKNKSLFKRRKTKRKEKNRIKITNKVIEIFSDIPVVMIGGNNGYSEVVIVHTHTPQSTLLGCQLTSLSCKPFSFH